MQIINKTGTRTNCQNLNNELLFPRRPEGYHKINEGGFIENSYFQEGYHKINDGGYLLKAPTAYALYLLLKTMFSNCFQIEIIIG